MRRWIIRLSLTIGTIAAVVLTLSWWALRQTQVVPEFYSKATESKVERTEVTQRMRREVKQLRANAAKQGSWRASFSDEEINAWLAEELPRKFPRLLARGASDPRILIEDDRIRVAVRYQNSRIDTVISCDVHVELTEEPNMLAVRLNRLQAGALPLPLSRFLKGITKEAAKGDIDVRWDLTEAGPVALVTVPSNEPRYVVTPVIVESVNLIDGHLCLHGHSGPLAHASFEPQGSVHKFVSYQPRVNRNSHASRPSSPSRVR